MGSASEDEEDDDNSTASSVLKHHSLHSSLPPAPGETNNNSLPHSDISSSIGQVCMDLFFFNCNLKIKNTIIHSWLLSVIYSCYIFFLFRIHLVQLLCLIVRCNNKKCSLNILVFMNCEFQG